jgi:hypothetical protein
MILYIQIVMCFVCEGTFIPAVFVCVCLRVRERIMLCIHKQVGEQN